VRLLSEAVHQVPRVVLNDGMMPEGFRCRRFRSWSSRLAASGGGALIGLISAGVAACLIADLAWYWCGQRSGGRVLGWLCRMSLSPDRCVSQTETMFLKIGKSSLPFAKFLPALSTMSVAMAGISRMPLALFVLLDAVGALLFVSVALLLGWAFQDSIADLLKAIPDAGKVGMLGLLVLLCLYLLMRWWRRRLFMRQLRMDRITVAELRRAIEDGRNPLILDARPKEIRLRDGMIAGAMPAAPEDLDSILAASRSAPTVVVYCACPNDASAAMVAKRLQQAGLKGNRSVDRRRIAVGSLAVTRLETISFDSFYFYSMPAPPA
jgi:membrane protein DedA with SNARE-associated domain/rhodanese-related sulfurtransferase